MRIIISSLRQLINRLETLLSPPPLYQICQKEKRKKVQRLIEEQVELKGLIIRTRNKAYNVLKMLEDNDVKD